MAGENIGDDLVWLWHDSHYEYVSDWDVTDAGAVPYVNAASLESALKLLDGAACVERRGAAYLIREKLGLPHPAKRSE